MPRGMPRQDRHPADAAAPAKRPRGGRAALWRSPRIARRVADDQGVAADGGAAVGAEAGGSTRQTPRRGRWRETAGCGAFHRRCPAGRVTGRSQLSPRAPSGSAGGMECAMSERTRRWYENSRTTPIRHSGARRIPAPQEPSPIQSPAVAGSSKWRWRGHFIPLVLPVATGLDGSRTAPVQFSIRGGNPSPARQCCGARACPVPQLRESTQLRFE